MLKGDESVIRLSSAPLISLKWDVWVSWQRLAKQTKTDYDKYMISKVPAESSINQMNTAINTVSLMLGCISESSLIRELWQRVWSLFLLNGIGNEAIIISV